MLGKANFSCWTDLGAKELDSRLPHRFSVSGVPADVHEHIEAVQSDLTGHSSRFLMVYGICSTCKLFQGLFQTTLLPRGQYNSWSKYFFAEAGLNLTLYDRIPSTTPGAEPPRDARDSGSDRSRSMHLETSSPDRPKMVTYMEFKTVSSYMSVKVTQRTFRMPNFTRATPAQPSLSNFLWRDSDFGEQTRSRRTTQLEQNFPTSPQNQKTKLTHCSIYVPMRTISTHR